MSRFTNDIDNVQMALEQSLVQLVSSVVSFIGIVILMLVLSPILFLVTFLMLGLMFFLIGKIAKRSSQFFKAQQANLGSVNGYVEEMVDGLKVVKVFTHEQEAIAEFKLRNEAYRQSATSANFYAGAVMPIMGNLNNITYALTAMFGGHPGGGVRFDIGSLAAFLQYSRQCGHARTDDHQPAQRDPGSHGWGGASLPGDGRAGRVRRGDGDPGWRISKQTAVWWLEMESNPTGRLTEGQP